MKVALALGLWAIGSAGLADVTVRFVEGAPTDRFIIQSDAGVCADGPIALTIDLTNTTGGLIFDVTSAGAGVEVFQPVVFVAGADLVRAVTPVQDGDQVIRIELAAVPPGAEIAFTMDVDDTIGAREITVSGEEFTGAVAQLTMDGEATTARFEAGPLARIAVADCLS